MYKKFFKRLIDFLIAFCVLSVIWPILLVVTIWLHFANNGAGAFFLQQRPGKGGKIFKVIKFKTMTDDRDVDGKLLPDAQRLTKVGKFVRTTSIDELPQFINVIKGDMALIGPRPLLPKYLTLYSKSSFAVMRFGQVLQVGPKSTVEIISPGQKHLNLMFGMLIIVH